MISDLLKSRSIKNSLWMMSEKIISIFGLIFVTSFVAKYIGPANFGKLTFATSIFSIVHTVAMLGSDNVIFQKTSRNRKVGEKIIYSTKLLRDTIFVTLSFLLLVYLYLAFDYLTFIFSLATCIGIYFLLHDVYSIYFNAILESKINTIANIFGLLVALLLRFIVAYFEMSVEWLSVPIVLATLIPYLIKKYIFSRKAVYSGDDSNNYYRHYRRYILGVGKKLVLYSLSVSIFTKTSQLFLGYKSASDLGIYTVALTLGTSFYFVLVALISSFMPKIYQQSDLDQSQTMVAKLNAAVIIISFFAFIFFYIFGEWIINKLYGIEFSDAAKILPIMVVVCLFSGISTVSEKYMMKFNAYSYLQKKTNILLMFNIIITAILIYYWGIMGAVYSILMTEIFSATILNYFFNHRLILKSHIKMLNIFFTKVLR
ncbi:oligosaccharide flippase family protein [Acinetobacter ursingii]|uniref:Oligosaccharide flippase family protein n=1 Tax=Acinetobacter ursingii TaxID=108980 RepID=A0A7T9UJG5_9GAMM|nr:oligosaccharide flippase family protein [Acinetobacter ursingii]QQT87001.1 oligosaccharide flippase family protein [Acinetobacter ursingii]